MTASGLVSRVTPVQTALRNCTRDEGRSFEVGNQGLISSHRKLLRPKAVVVSVAENVGAPFAPRALPRFDAVGSEEAPNEELASVRRTNRTYSFPVSGFHERAFAICSEGISETRLTSLNSVRNRLVGYSFHAALRHRLVRCDHSRRIIQPSS